VKRADKLRVDWSKGESDVLIHFPLGFGTKSDGHYISAVFDKDFLREMQERGYDTATLKFEISPTKGNPKFRSQRPDDSTED